MKTFTLTLCWDQSLCVADGQTGLSCHMKTHTPHHKKPSMLPHCPVHTILIKAPLETVQAVLFPLIKAKTDSFNEMRLIMAYQ